MSPICILAVCYIDSLKKLIRVKFRFPCSKWIEQHYFALNIYILFCNNILSYFEAERMLCVNMYSKF